MTHGRPGSAGFGQPRSRFFLDMRTLHLLAVAALLALPLLSSCSNDEPTPPGTGRKAGDYLRDVRSPALVGEPFAGHVTPAPLADTPAPMSAPGAQAETPPPTAAGG